MTSVYLLLTVRLHVTRLFQNLAIFAIKAAMLVSGIMDISVDPSANKDRTHHLKREPVWDEIHRSL